mmetsp:Transcript_53668/g.85789  ORF Transcript_53668/g.85789 Transcript_53668/m.85789 type:complete len:405 (-) Transcript_53668:17-1231(-)
MSETSRLHKVISNTTTTRKSSQSPFAYQASINQFANNFPFCLLLLLHVVDHFIRFLLLHFLFLLLLLLLFARTEIMRQSVLFTDFRRFRFCFRVRILILLILTICTIIILLLFIMITFHLPMTFTILLLFFLLLLLFALLLFLFLVLFALILAILALILFILQLEQIRNIILFHLVMLNRHQIVFFLHKQHGFLDGQRIQHTILLLHVSNRRQTDDYRNILGIASLPLIREPNRIFVFQLVVQPAISLSVLHEIAIIERLFVVLVIGINQPFIIFIAIASEQSSLLLMLNLFHFSLFVLVVVVNVFALQIIDISIPFNAGILAVVVDHIRIHTQSHQWRTTQLFDIDLQLTRLVLVDAKKLRTIILLKTPVFVSQCLAVLVVVAVHADVVVLVVVGIVIDLHAR